MYCIVHKVRDTTHINMFRLVKVFIRIVKYMYVHKDHFDIRHLIIYDCKIISESFEKHLFVTSEFGLCRKQTFLCKGKHIGHYYIDAYVFPVSTARQKRMN